MGCKGCGNGMEFLGNSDCIEVNIPACTTIKTTPVTCATDVKATYKCGCVPDKCKCKRDSCCGNTTFNAPQPFYADSKCYETVCHDKFNSLVKNGVKIIKEFTVPACGVTTPMYVDSFAYFPVGAYIFHGLTSYLKVVDQRPSENVLMVKNECSLTSETVGQLVPVCSVFSIIPEVPSSGQGTGGQKFLGQDFIVPAVDECESAYVVPNVTGIQVNDTVQFAAGTYTVSQIVSANVIRICNNGYGGVPGSVVYALDANNTFQHPITVVEENPCNTTPVTAAKPVGCSEGKVKLITGPTGGLFTLNEDGTADFKNYVLPVVACQTLTACFLLTPEGTDLIATVSSTSGYAVNDSLELTYGNIVYKFTVTAVLDATHIELTLENPPEELINIPPGTQLCDPSCCTILEDRLDNICPEIAEQCCAQSVEHTGWFKIPYCVSPKATTFPAAGRYGTWELDLNSMPYENETECAVDVEIDCQIIGFHGNVVTSVADDDLRVRYAINMLAEHAGGTTVGNATSPWFFYGLAEYTADLNDSATGYPANVDFNTAGQPFSYTWGGFHFTDVAAVGPGGTPSWKLRVGAIYDRLDASYASEVNIQDYFCVEYWYRFKVFRR